MLKKDSCFLPIWYKLFIRANNCMLFPLLRWCWDNKDSVLLWYSWPKKDIPPYYISPIEMRSLWQTITCIKSPSIPLNLTCVCLEGWDLSKEVLWVSVGQLASKLQAVNVRGLKKILPIGRFEPGSPMVRRSAEFVQFLGLFLNGNESVSHFRISFSNSKSTYAVLELSLAVIVFSIIKKV